MGRLQRVLALLRKMNQDRDRVDSPPLTEPVSLKPM